MVALPRPAASLSAGLALVLALPAGGAGAFSLTPMLLQEPSGILQIRNEKDRSLPVEIRAYPARRVNGVMTAALQPYSAEEQQRLVRLRPPAVRLRWRSARNVSYRILDPSRPFYLCATTPQGTLLLRLCSRWPGPS